MDLDPALKFALAIHSAPGTHALRLGSGISRAAGIPTGWELVLDLIRMAAAAAGERASADPADWYRRRFSESPDYARLLAGSGRLTWSAARQCVRPSTRRETT